MTLQLGQAFIKCFDLESSSINYKVSLLQDTAKACNTFIAQTIHQSDLTAEKVHAIHC